MLKRFLVASLLAFAPALLQARTEPAPYRMTVTVTHAAEWSTPTIAGILRNIEVSDELQVTREALMLADGSLNSTNSTNTPNTPLAMRGVGGPIRLAFAGGDGGIAVLFPDIGEPYRGVFNKIIEGIEDQTKTRVLSVPLAVNADPTEVGAQLRKQDVRVVIALGKHGLKAAISLDPKIEVIAGAVLAVGENEAKNNTIVSLAPDPNLLFARLKAMQAGIRRVTVVYNPAQNDWLIRLARIAAKEQGLELNALAASDLKAAIRQYQDFLASSSKGDALWLPQDSTTVEDSSVLPLVLKESWDRGLPLFSSSVAHVRRGVLFSLYPNNVELGRLLANSALGHLGTGNKPAKGMLPLRDVLAAVNTRTASHLGINLRPQSFDLLLPEN